jgi:hypothetical protein
LARTVTPATGLAGATVAAGEPLSERTTERPPLAVLSERILPAVDIASASRETTVVAADAGMTGPDASVAPQRTSAPTKREVRFMMTSV